MGGTLQKLLLLLAVLSFFAASSPQVVRAVEQIPNSTVETNDMPLWVARDRQLLDLMVSSTRVDIIVARDGSGNYTTIGAAVAAAPDRLRRGNKHVIYIKRGVYHEKVEVPKNNIVLIGDGINETIITGNWSVKGGLSSYDSAVVFVSGQRFMARDLSIENTAGATMESAVALRSISKQSVYFRCEFKGFQDTLLADKDRQFYRECQISGTVDFVFGNAKAVFQNCLILVRRPAAGNYNVITAQGRDGKDNSSGFSFQNCTVKAYEDLTGVETYLGRPWRNHSHVVFMQCFLDSIVHPSGWAPWKKEHVNAQYTSTIFYGEYNNTGPGADLSTRVHWPGFHVLNDGEAAKYTVEEFIHGNQWLPATGVEYKPGL